MINKSTKNREFNHFNDISNEWWIPNGKFKILHDITPIRVKYILEQTSNINA